MHGVPSVGSMQCVTENLREVTEWRCASLAVIGGVECG